MPHSVAQRPLPIADRLAAAKRWLDTPSTRIRLALAAWLFATFCYFLPAATWSPVSRFDLTRAIVEGGTLSIDAYADSTGDRARVEGHWFSDKAPIVALLAVPAYQAFHWIDRSRGNAPAYQARSAGGRPAVRVTVNRSFQRGLYVCSMSTAAAAGVAIGLLVFGLLRRRLPDRPALWGSALVVLCTPIFPYSTSFYGHAVAGAFFVGAAWLLDEHEPNGSASARRAAFVQRAAAGACLSLSVGCEYVIGAPAAALALTTLATTRPAERLRWLAAVALGALGPALVLAGYHWACFGAPWRTGYSYIVDPRFAAGHARGLLGIRLPTAEALWGLTFGTRRGLFYVAPVALPLLCGLIARSVARDRAAGSALVALVTLLLVNASYYMWWGGAAAAPRHLVPVLGLLCLGLPWLWADPWRRRATLVLAAVSLCNMLAISAAGLEAPERGNVLVDFAYERVLRGQISALRGASNLGMEFGIVRGGTLGPLLAWLLVGANVLHRQLVELATTDAAPDRVPAAAET